MYGYVNDLIFLTLLSERRK